MMKHIRKFAALVLMLVLALNCSVPALAAKEQIYTDVEDTAALELLSLAQVFDGYGDGTFRGNNLLNRAQLTKICCQLLGLEVDENAVAPFADTTDNWAEQYIAAAYEAGIVNGKTATTFDPDASVTHYQAAMIFARMVGYNDAAIATLPWAERVETAVVAAGLAGAIELSNKPLTRMEAANAAYATLLCQKLGSTPTGASLTANTLAGDLGITAIPGTNAQGVKTIRFSFVRDGVTKKTAAYSLTSAATWPMAESSAVLAPSSSAVLCYGYLIDEPGLALWQDGETYHYLSLWNGQRLGNMYTKASVPAWPDHVLAAYEVAADGSVESLRFYYAGNGSLYTGAIKMMEEENFLVFSDGATRKFTEDTQILYVDTAADSPEEMGRIGDALSVADQNSDGSWIDNVLYTLDEDGNLACIVADVNNQLVSPAL